MAEQTTLPAADLIDYAAIDRAHELATRDALLEHARMGRSVSEWRDGRIVTVPPEEIFARYGLDPNGKPLPTANGPAAHGERAEKVGGRPDSEMGPLSPELIARIDAHDRLHKMAGEGKLDEYAGGYVISDGETIFAHGRNLLKVRERAEKKARAKGVSPDLLVDYYVPGPGMKYLK